jgi:hypothetical protein
MNHTQIRYERSVIRLTDESGDPGWYHLSVKGSAWKLRRIAPGDDFEVVLRGKNHDPDAAVHKQKYVPDRQFTVDQARLLARVTKVPSVDKKEDLEQWVFIAKELERRCQLGTIDAVTTADSSTEICAEGSAEQRRVVPVTSLRKLYQWLQKEPVGLHAAIAEGILGRPEELHRLLARALKKLTDYTNQEPLLDRPRPTLPPFQGNELSGTNDLVAALQAKAGHVIVEDQESLNFSYVEREVSPLRTTSGVYEDGWPASNSGSGGIDVLLLSQDGVVPIVGEIKVATDKNPFFALVQALTYASELATLSQFQRLKHWLSQGYGLEIGPADSMPLLDIYIILANYPGDRDPYKNILDVTRRLSER